LFEILTIALFPAHLNWNLSSNDFWSARIIQRFL